MESYVTLVHTGYLWPRVAALAVGCALLIAFSWIGSRAVQDRRCTALVRMGWPFGVALCVFSIFLASLTL